MGKPKLKNRPIPLLQDFTEGPKESRKPARGTPTSNGICDGDVPLVDLMPNFRDVGPARVPKKVGRCRRPVAN